MDQTISYIASVLYSNPVAYKSQKLDETKRNGLGERDYNQMQTSTRTLGQYISLIYNNKETKSSMRPKGMV